MTLLEKQFGFSRQLAIFLGDLETLGYDVTMGEAWRPDFTAQHYAQMGKGIVSSLHRLRLAVDLNLFKDRQFLTRTEDYEPAGKLWEGYTQSGLIFCWGGRFTKPDANHFSVTHNGIR